jgi:hypothetical protein
MVCPVVSGLTSSLLDPNDCSQRTMAWIEEPVREGTCTPSVLRLLMAHVAYRVRSLFFSPWNSLLLSRDHHLSMPLHRTHQLDDHAGVRLHTCQLCSERFTLDFALRFQEVRCVLWPYEASCPTTSFENWF